jgi:CubicO group peptidase (beta-lactamase class C family)
VEAFTVKKSVRKRLFWLGCAAIFSSAAIFALSPKQVAKPPIAAASKSAEPDAGTPKTHELTAEDLSAFLDGLMPVQIGHADIAGAVVAVVKDGKLLYAKGFGYADVAKKIPVDPETTLFRPGSISKTFAWTAVMQQVELGKLDLDRDVNDYLDFKIPPAFGKPITLRNIMTHSTGYEETLKDLFLSNDKDLVPIGDYLRVHMPARIFPPGVTPAYSNYATTMAAYVVERVSGQDFNSYVEEHFFKPLNMTHASFRQPLPENLKPSMSQGYILGSGEPKPFEVVQVAPAGSLSASAVDMTHWMIMHLQNGKYGDVQILKPETAIQMHTRQPGWPDAMHAMCLGFYEQSLNGHRSIGHGGDTVSFHSDMHLLLNDNVGLFMSVNSPGRDQTDLRGTIFTQFMDRYFPEAPVNEPELPTAAQDAHSVEGSYMVSRRFQTNILAVTAVLGETKVIADPKGNTISVDGFDGLNGQPKHFREISSGVYREVGGKDKLAFVKDAIGRPVFYVDYPFMVFLRVDNPLNKKGLNLFIIGFSLTVVALSLLLWPIGAMFRSHYGKPLTLDPAAKRLRMLVRLECIAIVIFCVGMVTIVSKVATLAISAEGMDIWIHLLQVIGVLTSVGALIALLSAFKSWGDSQQWLWYKIWNTLLAFGCVGFFWFIFHWNLLNFHLNY